MTRRRFGQIVAALQRLPAEQRAAELERRLAENARCGVTRYLLGCQELDRGRAPAGVRHMMVAHHAEPDLQSAALLVFAGLNWVRRRGTALLPVLLETWDEFRRPSFDVYPRERSLLDAFYEPCPPLEGDAGLARRLWRLPIASLRLQISAVMASRQPDMYSVLSAPA